MRTRTCRATTPESPFPVAGTDSVLSAAKSHGTKAGNSSVSSVTLLLHVRAIGFAWNRTGPVGSIFAGGAPLDIGRSRVSCAVPAGGGGVGGGAPGGAGVPLGGVPGAGVAPPPAVHQTASIPPPASTRKRRT